MLLIRHLDVTVFVYSLARAHCDKQQEVQKQVKFPLFVVVLKSIFILAMKTYWGGNHAHKLTLKTH